MDRTLVQEFARELFGHYTSGILTLMVDIGHRTGLFEALQAGGTSDEIAGRAGLDERYVREWLGAIATAGIAEYDPTSRTFTLPAEHAVCLTGTSSRNLAPGSHMLTMLARHVGGVADCFRNGGGVPYSDFRPDFTEAADASPTSTSSPPSIRSTTSATPPPPSGESPGRYAPGGVYFMVEPKASSNLEDNIGNPFAPYIYGVSVLHCLTVSLAEGGAGLGTAWGEQTARRMLEDAGFTNIEVVDAPGPQNSIYVAHPAHS